MTVVLDKDVNVFPITDRSTAGGLQLPSRVCTDDPSTDACSKQIAPTLHLRPGKGRVLVIQD